MSIQNLFAMDSMPGTVFAVVIIFLALIGLPSPGQLWLRRDLGQPPASRTDACRWSICDFSRPAWAYGMAHTPPGLIPSMISSLTPLTSQPGRGSADRYRYRLPFR